MDEQTVPTNVGSNDQLGLSPAVAAPQPGGHTEQHLLRSGIAVTIHFSSMPTADTYKSIGRVMAFKGGRLCRAGPASRRGLRVRLRAKPAQRGLSASGFVKYIRPEVSCPHCDGDFIVSTRVSYSFSTDQQEDD